MINLLKKHHSVQMYHPEQEFSNVVNVNGSYLGPYIPYVGSTYCEAKPRILIYAMAQNLARAEGLIHKFLRNSIKDCYDSRATPILLTFTFIRMMMVISPF